MELFRIRNSPLKLLNRLVTLQPVKISCRCHFTHKQLRVTKIFPNIAHVTSVPSSAKSEEKTTSCKSHRFVKWLTFVVNGASSYGIFLWITQKGIIRKERKLMMQCKLLFGGAAGTFTMSPFMTRAIEKLHRLIDWEMQSLGAQKITMPCIASGELWKSSKRWDLMGSELFTFKDRLEKDLCLAPTHEEAVTTYAASDKDIPPSKLSLRLYQIGRKFRDEMRPKHGLLRCREFEMKDLYTFDLDEQGALATYEDVCQAYDRLFNDKLKLDAVKVEASSASMKGSKSHEYHIVADIGEDTLLVCSKCGRSINQELTELSSSATDCDKENCPKDFNQLSGIEIAHAFYLGTGYSQLYKAYSTDTNSGKHVPTQMGCFGIGVTRLLAAAAELLSTEDELRWPRLIAPHQVCIVPQMSGFRFEDSLEMAESLHKDLLSLANLRNEVVMDDRHNQTIGKRVRAARRIGFPHIVVLGKKVLESQPLFEYIDVYREETSYLTREALLERLGRVETVIL